MSEIQNYNENGEYELELLNADQMQSSNNVPVSHQQSTMEQSQSSDLNFTKWSCKHCNIKDAFEYLESSELQISLNDVDKALLIRLIIDNDFDKLSDEEIHKIERVFSTKAVVIFFMSKDFSSMLIYWKSKNIDYLLNLAPPKKLSTLECKEVYGFVADFLIYSLGCGHLGIHKDTVHSNESKKIDINRLVDSQNLDILQLCVDLGERTCVQILLKLSIFEDKHLERSNAPSLAWKNNNFDVLLMLLEANFTYPPKKTADEFPPKVQQYIQVCEDLHEAVIAKNIPKIEDILKQNPNRRHFYNKSNQSALKVALEKGLYSMYEILLSNDICFGPHEPFDRVFAGLNENDKTILREIHFRCSKDLPESHMNVLMMNTTISHDDMEKEGKEDLVLRAYRFLNKNPNLNPILKVVAASKRFNIIFDFKRNSVAAVDPTAPPDMRGFYRLDRKICVGAKQLLDPLTEHETFGTLAHELCHYALNLTFKNIAKPYAKNDQTSKEEFKTIFEFCKNNQNRDDIIDYAFKERPKVLKAELIVRAPHLIAMYDNQPEKLAELQNFYPGLFNYHTKKVIPAMIKAIPDIRRQADMEIKEKDKKIFKLTRNFYIAIGLGILIAGLVGLVFYKPTYVFNELPVEDKETVRNAFVSYKNVSIQFKDIFGNDSIAYGKLTSDHIKDMLDGIMLDFSDSKLLYLEPFVSFEWDGMHQKLKKRFLELDVSFQEQDVKLENLKESSPNAFHALTPDQIIYVLSGEKLKIGKKVPIDTEFYTPRIFVTNDARSIVFEYTYGHDYQHKFNIQEDHTKSRKEMLNQTLKEFTENFMKQPFDVQREIFNKIERNLAMQSGYFDSSHNDSVFMHKHVEEILTKAFKDGILILSSEAGAGKTTTFKQLSVEIKQQNPVLWVSYIDLKNHTELYMKNLTIDELLLSILKLTDENRFEKEVFKELFKNGKVVLLWNGFDEISPTHNEFIINLIHNIHKTTNITQFVCTRPLYASQLINEFKVHAWQLVTFNDKDKDNFLREFFIYKNMEEEFIASNITAVKKVIEKLSYDFYMYRAFNTPLMLKLIAETYENQNLLKSKNTYAIYETFVLKKVKIWLERGNDAFETTGKLFSKGSQFSIIKIFQKYAFLNELNLLNMCTLGIKIQKLQIMQEKIPKYLPFEDISGMGILYINGKNKFEFAHKTFAEFFIAQYFMENIYRAESAVSEYEAELRLELFFKFTKDFEEKQKLITDFMISALEIEDESDETEFAPAISNLLRTKFKKFFFRLLDTNFSNVFEFLFKFFKKDYNLLTDLLYVNQSETLYTAVFNPNYFALSTNPKGIQQISEDFLDHDDHEKMISGRNQKGVIMYGIYVYQQIRAANYKIIAKFHSFGYNNQVKDLNCSNFLDVVEKISKNLTKAEQKELLLVAVNPQVYLYYENITNFLNGFGSFKDDYLKIWDNLRQHLTKEELKLAIANAIIQFNSISPYKKVGSYICLDILLELTASQNFTNTEIYELFMDNNILHDSHDFDYAFMNLWKFLLKFTTNDQRRNILKKLDTDDLDLYFYKISGDLKLLFSNNTYKYYHYDLTPFNILQKALTIVDGSTLSFTFEIYNQHFTVKEIQEIITSSLDLPYYMIVLDYEKPCIKFLEFLEKVFEGDEKLLIDYFDAKISPPGMSALELVENYREISKAPTFWFDNLKIFTDFFKKISKKLLDKNSYNYK